MRRATSVLFLLSVVGACAPPPEEPTVHPVYVIEGPIMGTTFSVKVVSDVLDDSRVMSLRVAVEETLAAIDHKMSTYRADSELSRFNAVRTTDPFPVSADTIAVFQHAREISELTEGAFDVTVGPLVDAWGFGPRGQPATWPADADIERLKTHVGYERLEINVDAATLRKTDPMTVSDLSALAKGYAVDRVVALLHAEGFRSLLVEVGGEVRTSGRSERGDDWRVGIERPVLGPPAVQRLFRLRDRALATSGDYRNYYEVGGRRISHTIDPRSGRPVSHGLASVGVIAPLCVQADAMATALEVLGPDEGFALAVEHNWAALLIGRRADGVNQRQRFDNKGVFSRHPGIAGF